MGGKTGGGRRGQQFRLLSASMRPDLLYLRGMDSWRRYDKSFREEGDHESHQIVCIVLLTDTKYTAGERLCRRIDRMYMYTVYRLFPVDNEWQFPLDSWNLFDE